MVYFRLSYFCSYASLSFINFQRDGPTGPPLDGNDHEHDDGRGDVLQHHHLHHRGGCSNDDGPTEVRKLKRSPLCKGVRCKMGISSTSTCLSPMKTSVSIFPPSFHQKSPFVENHDHPEEIWLQKSTAGKNTCEKHEKCFFYFFYTAPTKNRQWLQ